MDQRLRSSADNCTDDWTDDWTDDHTTVASLERDGVGSKAELIV
jgi:hypothetical protein